jgi:hypothetical protein
VQSLPSALSRLLFAVVLACAAALPRTALGQTAADSATAEILFDEALGLLENGKAAEACFKLEESQRLDPGVGTLLYLADCYQQTGRTASAWATFKEAAYMAKARADERETVAIEQARQLEPTLSYLTLDVSARVSDLTLLHDGKVVGQPLWGTAFPVDPGVHRLEAGAPGKKTWSTSIQIAPGPHQERVIIPALEDAPPEPLTPPPAQSGTVAESDHGTQRTVGWVLLGAGGAAIVTGGVFALLARSDNSDAEAECRPDRQNLCNQAGVDLADSASTKATLAGVSAGVGLAAAGAGITLLLTAPSSAPSSSELTLSANPLQGGAELSLSGSF